MGGFTLLEMMIAIGIFALIGVASHQLFNSIMTQKSIVDEHTLALQKLQKSLYLIKRDLGQIVARAPRDGYGEPMQILVSDYGLVEFTHQGWDNPLGQKRSALQRVRYSLEKNQLQRQYWNVLDRAEDSKFNTQVLMDNVEIFQVYYRNKESSWQTDWAVSDDELKNRLPSGIKFMIEHTIFGELEVWVDLPAATEIEDES
jgi:general secretion pathway protein J